MFSVTYRTNPDLSWISVSKDAPYFVTENGASWTPIGQNDAITWPDLAGLYRRTNPEGLHRYLQTLVDHGVTCLRLMLEYVEGESHFLENPAGSFRREMIGLWDDLFVACGQHGLRLLLTPFDTYWMWRRWGYHPYNRSNGGPCTARTRWLVCPETRAAIRQRLAFVTERWGHSGILFAWDLWNEIKPIVAGQTTDPLVDFVGETSAFLRRTEERLYGRSHLQTVSVCCPTLQKYPDLVDRILNHADLDFASIHLYEPGAIDAPRNTIDAARRTGDWIRRITRSTSPGLPVLDSEHGPIHTYKKRRHGLAEPFDDEYFRHIQWAHAASGGAGGGMRWPYRRPHTLTPGMRSAQQSLSRFSSLVHWAAFRRTNWNEEIAVSDGSIVPFGCGYDRQALVWLLRTGSLARNGLLGSIDRPSSPVVTLPALPEGSYEVIAWNTGEGVEMTRFNVDHSGGLFVFQSPPFSHDLAFAVRTAR